MFNRELVYLYENVLTGNLDKIPDYLFRNEREREENALYIIRYAFETYLRWSPQDVKNYITLEIIQRLKLDRYLKYINTPPYIQLSNKHDIFYIAAKLYPDEIKFDEKKLVLRVYKKILSRDLKRFPKDYLSGYDGYVRSQLCFRYMVTQFMSFGSIDEIYEFFGTRKCKKAMEKYHLMNVCQKLYTTPLDYMHESLSDRQKDELLYLYYLYLNIILKAK